MSLESSIAGLVTASNKLTEAVGNKLGEIDKAVDAAGVKFDNQIIDLKTRLPRLAVTRNFRMMDTDANGYPDAWGFHAEVTPGMIREIAAISEGAGRPAADIALLAEIERDVREQYPNFDIRRQQYYRSTFTVWKFSWAKRSDAPSAYLSYPMAADQTASTSPSVPTNSYTTFGAFVKLVEGSIGGGWAVGAVLGKWRWCSVVLSPDNAFGGYTISHPMRLTDSGNLQVAFAGAATGVITDPNSWGAMLNIGG